MGHVLPHADPVHKVSIVTRGQTGGYTRFIPPEDRYLTSRAQFNDMLATALGGRVAEELIFNEITTGASNDLEHATSLARSMVTRYGMSDRLGPRTFGKREELVFLGRELGESRDYGDRVAEEIDQEVHAIIQAAHTAATELLTAHKAKLVQLARQQLELQLFLLLHRCLRLPRKRLKL